MKLASYLRTSRHHVYCFRRRVPDDLRKHFPSSEVRYSLKTKDKRAAVWLARLHALKIDALFTKVRNMATKKKPDDGSFDVGLTVRADLREMGLGKLEVDFDVNKPGEREEADRQIAQFLKHAEAPQTEGATAHQLLQSLHRQPWLGAVDRPAYGNGLAYLARRESRKHWLLNPQPDRWLVGRSIGFETYRCALSYMPDPHAYQQSG